MQKPFTFLGLVTYWLHRQSLLIYSMGIFIIGSHTISVTVALSSKNNMGNTKKNKKKRSQSNVRNYNTKNLLNGSKSESKSESKIIKLTKQNAEFETAITEQEEELENLREELKVQLERNETLANQNYELTGTLNNGEEAKEIMESYYRGVENNLKELEEEKSKLEEEKSKLEEEKSNLEEDFLYKENNFKNKKELLEQKILFLQEDHKLKIMKKDKELEKERDWQLKNNIKELNHLEILELEQNNKVKKDLEMVINIIEEINKYIEKISGKLNEVESKLIAIEEHLSRVSIAVGEEKMSPLAGTQENVIFQNNSLLSSLHSLFADLNKEGSEDKSSLQLSYEEEEEIDKKETSTSLSVELNESSFVNIMISPDAQEKKKTIEPKEELETEKNKDEVNMVFTLVAIVGAILFLVFSPTEKGKKKKNNKCKIKKPLAVKNSISNKKKSNRDLLTPCNDSALKKPPPLSVENKNTLIDQPTLPASANAKQSADQKALWYMIMLCLAIMGVLVGGAMILMRRRQKNKKEAT